MKPKAPVTTRRRQPSVDGGGVVCVCVLSWWVCVHVRIGDGGQPLYLHRLAVDMENGDVNCQCHKKHQIGSKAQECFVK